MDRRLNGLLNFINRIERRYGNLNEFFHLIFEGCVDTKEIIAVLYTYDLQFGLDVDFDEYLARFSDKSFECILERIKVIAKEVYQVMSECPEYKPWKGITNRYSNDKLYKY